MARVVHFEFAVDDADRALAFYREVFGWKIEKWEGPTDYWLIATGEGDAGIDGALTPRDADTPNTVVTVDVESVDDAMAKITAAGGRAVTPKIAVPGVGYMAYCEDTEGNRFGLMQADPSALPA